MDTDEIIDHPAWPARAWLLMAMGGAFGFVFHALMRDGRTLTQTEDPLRVAAAAFVAVSGIVFAVSLERLRWTWSAAFALLAGLVVAGVAYANGAPSGWASDEAGHFAACLLAVAIAVPLFQAIRDQGRVRLPVRPVHSHVWANLILAAAAAAFVVATFLLALLLSELFKLIGVRLLADLLNKNWFPWMLGCGALGAALGILRDRDSVLGALQRVVRAVLAFLAPVLSLGLVLFVLALPFTGLTPLWEQTKSTTPILLVCIAGAVILANAAIGNAPDEEPVRRPLRWTAAALAAIIAPLALVAAVSTGKRIAQYGYTPDRLWAAVFVAVAAAAAAAYAVALVRGRAHWPDRVRRANLHLAAGICLLALVLALPAVSFGAISARDQVARLEAGKVAPDKFDWAALRFDFGPAGRRAVERLAASGAAAVRDRARAALKAPSRYEIERASAPPPVVRLTTDGGRPVPERLRAAIARDGECSPGCRLVFPDAAEAIAVGRPCETCAASVRIYVPLASGEWAQLEPAAPSPPESAPRPLGAVRVELREVRKRQVFVDGRPAGPVYDPAP
jgi:hypothetical protein